MIAPEVTEAAGITYRVLDYWTTRGYIVPEYTTNRGSEKRTDRDPVNPGSGSARHYSDAEVNVCVRMAKLVRAGFECARAAVIAREWLASGTLEHELPGGVVVLIRDAGLAAANIPILLMALAAASLAGPSVYTWAATHLPDNPLATAALMVGVSWCGWQLARWLRGRSWIRVAS